MVIEKKYFRRLNFSEVKKRDNNVCQKCGRNGEECHLEVHHKIAICHGGTNEMDNLILLCHDCHKHAPDSCNECFDNFLLPPVHLSFQLSSAILPHFYLEFISKVSECFNVKLDINDKECFDKLLVPDSCNGKVFLEIYNPNYTDFYIDKLVDIFNTGKNKCRGYTLWKEQMKKKTKLN